MKKFCILIVGLFIWGNTAFGMENDIEELSQAPGVGLVAPYQGLSGQNIIDIAGIPGTDMSINIGLLRSFLEAGTDVSVVHEGDITLFGSGTITGGGNITIQAGVIPPSIPHQ